jgi:hypothetical protein
MVKRDFVIGFISCLFLVGCAGFSYHYYGLSDVSYDHGILLGPKPKDDLPFSKCAPTETSKNPCVVMFATDFFQFKQDYLDTQQKLIDCEKK